VGAWPKGITVGNWREGGRAAQSLIVKHTDFLNCRITGPSFYPCDTMLARVLAMAVCLCLSQVGVLSKRLNKSGWFLAWELFPPILQRVIRKFRYLQK